MKDSQNYKHALENKLYVARNKITFKNTDVFCDLEGYF